MHKGVQASRGKQRGGQWGKKKSNVYKILMEKMKPLVAVLERDKETLPGELQSLFLCQKHVWEPLQLINWGWCRLITTFRQLPPGDLRRDPESIRSPLAVLWEPTTNSGLCAQMFLFVCRENIKKLNHGVSLQLLGNTLLQISKFH